MSTTTDVIIIGAGAAGLFCAARTAAEGRSVRILDHANKAGKKILMSGGGRCNFTNYYIEPTCYLSQNPHFCKSALSRYTQWDFIDLVSQYGIPFHEKKDGQLFCDNKSSDILEMLLEECRRAGAEVQLNTSVEALKKSDKGFILTTSAGDYSCRSVVVATGGPSIPTLGATGFGYDLARQFGHQVFAPRAALVPFTITDQLSTLCKALSGTALPVSVSCREQVFNDDLLFTHRGISGPSVLQISNYWRPGDEIVIDLLPGTDANEWLLGAKKQQGKSLLKTVLAQRLSKSLVRELQGLWWADHEQTVLAEFSDQRLTDVANHINAWHLKPSATEGYRTAEVTLGGVDTNSISSKTMEAKQQPGLYFVGEVLDVSGHLGGFNFQWAWSSGYVAGVSV